MDESQKTKSELVKEIKTMHRRLAQLEKKRVLSREEKLKLEIIDHAPFSAWACNRKYEIIMWSAGTSKIYGCSGEDAIQKSYLNIFVSEEERERSAMDCLKVIDDGFVQRNFLAYDEISDNTKRALLTNCFRIWDEETQDYLQAEVALEIPELEPIIEEHRTLRELGIKRKAEYDRILLLEHLGKINTLISSSILDSEGPKKVFEGILKIVADMINLELVSCICLYDESKHSWSTDISLSANDIFNKIKTLLGEYTITNKSILFVDNEYDVPEDLPKLLEWWKNDSQYSVASMPLISANKVVGAWLIAIRKPSKFQEGTREALRLVANQVAFAVHIAQLIQNLKDLNDKIAEKQDLITRSLIAVDFVHRMNNLAGPIRGWTGLIRENLNSNDDRDLKIKEYLNEIDDEAKGLLSAANNLEHTPKPQDIDINFMLNAMMHNIKIQYSNIKVETELFPNVYIVKAIYSQLSAAIWNVISNAIDAMPSGGTLKLLSRNYKDSTDNCAEIVIVDTGAGIPDEQRDKIFDINYTTKGPGRGYGLWRTKHVIEDLGGVVRLERTGLTGTTFLIRLPAFN